ncbi:hypothetical protein [Streptomyces sp. WAC 05379]|uniref:hypothetical protein n=1 Tax=Streptomyces sp. WAC 05379 TaxID=2203207 RepID=UPI000F740A59|nr:hypothetical protein [Streptomyces sp. WAC 05379]
MSALNETVAKAQAARGVGSADVHEMPKKETAAKKTTGKKQLAKKSTAKKATAWKASLRRPRSA